MKKPMIPISATPPATERPIIEPVPSELLLPLELLSAPLVAVEEADELLLVPDTTTVWITVPPAEFVDVTTVWLGGAVGGAEVCEALVAVDLAVSVEVVLVPVVLVAVVAEVVEEVVEVVEVDVDEEVVDVVEEEEVCVVEVAEAAVDDESPSPRMPVISARTAFGKCAELAECTRAKARKHERSNDLDPFIGYENLTLKSVAEF